jgi:hypothetical protein
MEIDQVLDLRAQIADALENHSSRYEEPDPGAHNSGRCHTLILGLAHGNKVRQKPDFSITAVGGKLYGYHME